MKLNRRSFFALLGSAFVKKPPGSVKWVPGYSDMISATMYHYRHRLRDSIIPSQSVYQLIKSKIDRANTNLNIQLVNSLYLIDKPRTHGRLVGIERIPPMVLIPDDLRKQKLWANRVEAIQSEALDKLNQWEFDFICSMEQLLNDGRMLTELQDKKLESIYARYTK